MCPRFLARLIHNLRELDFNFYDVKQPSSGAETDFVVQSVHKSSDGSQPGLERFAVGDELSVFQFDALSSKTCNDIIVEVENIKKHYPQAPLDEGVSLPALLT